MDPAAQEAPCAAALLAAYLRHWGAGSAQHLRRHGYVGTDAELAISYAEMSGDLVLAREFRADARWPGPATCAAVAALPAAAGLRMIATALGAPPDEARAAAPLILAALRTACRSSADPPGP